jgi:hypothetical protein
MSSDSRDHKLAIRTPDRITHHGEIIEIGNDSWRMKPPLRLKRLLRRDIHLNQWLGVDQNWMPVVGQFSMPIDNPHHISLLKT